MKIQRILKHDFYYINKNNILYQSIIISVESVQ